MAQEDEGARGDRDKNERDHDQEAHALWDTCRACGTSCLFDVTDMMSSASAMPYRDRATPGHRQRRGFAMTSRTGWGTHRMNRGSTITDP
jgi:hypothetical protein